jgi:hypothetical protein
MLEYEVETTIDADPHTVWRVLIDGPGYSDWDSGIIRVDGRIDGGERIKVTSEANPKRAFASTVTELVPDTAMTWVGGLPLGLFKGVRTFELGLVAGAHTHFRMHEVFSGPLCGLISRSMPDLQPSFDRFAAGLKAEAESRAP